MTAINDSKHNSDHNDETMATTTTGATMEAAATAALQLGCNASYSILKLQGP